MLILTCYQILHLRHAMHQENLLINNERHGYGSIYRLEDYRNLPPEDRVDYYEFLLLHSLGVFFLLCVLIGVFFISFVVADHYDTYAMKKTRFLGYYV